MVPGWPTASKPGGHRALIALRHLGELHRARRQVLAGRNATSNMFAVREREPADALISFPRAPNPRTPHLPREPGVSRKGQISSRTEGDPAHVPAHRGRRGFGRRPSAPAALRRGSSRRCPGFSLADQIVGPHATRPAPGKGLNQFKLIEVARAPGQTQRTSNVGRASETVLPKAPGPCRTYDIVSSGGRRDVLGENGGKIVRLPGVRSWVSVSWLCNPDRPGQLCCPALCRSSMAAADRRGPASGGMLRTWFGGRQPSRGPLQRPEGRLSTRRQRGDIDARSTRSRRAGRRVRRASALSRS